MVKITRLQLVLLLLSAASEPGASDTASNYEGSAATICHEQLFLQKLIAATESSVKQAKSDVANNADRFYELNMAACARKTEAAHLKYMALAAIQQSRATKAAAEARRLADSTEKPLRALTRRLAQLQALQHINRQEAPTSAAQSTARTAISGLTASSDKVCVVKLTHLTNKKEKCQPDNTNDPKIAKAAQQISSVKKIKLLADDNFKVRDQIVQLQANGNMGTYSNNVQSGGYCYTSGTSMANDGKGFGRAKITADTKDSALTHVALSDNGGTGTTCTAYDPAEDTGELVTANEIAKEICKLRTIKAQRPVKLEDQTVKDLEGDDTAGEVALILTRGGLPKDKTTTVVQAAIKLIFRDGQTKLKDSLLDKLNSKEIEYTNGETKAKTAISAAAKADENGKLLASCFEAIVDALRKKEKQAETDKITRSECTGKEKDVCNKKPGCKYNVGENKCEEDPAKTTTTPATTNTTGSNSVVINKSPFWLTVLVLA
uniref:Variant surface glycoprotein 1125.309 n=1 Tax=Trypanosoma brucei TaxID=5691 RepID=A0A1J0R5Q2_9TRYP|nr:variant surface glycoprotein 1125.309 [Trypanosoma brucei]